MIGGGGTGLTLGAGNGKSHGNMITFKNYHGTIFHWKLSLNLNIIPQVNLTNQIDLHLNAFHGTRQLGLNNKIHRNFMEFNGN